MPDELPNELPKLPSAQRGATRRNLAQQIGRIRDFDQLFVISHDDTFEGFTDRVVAVKG